MSLLTELEFALRCRTTDMPRRRRYLLQEALHESLEDMAIIRAIQLSEKSPLISRKKIFRRLQPTA